ncbi:hypothetical protein F5X96DRAFT_637228, partial [Biscogniauxia mediterranea]
MAPLGIITTIVSAIRVGGPTWLKAVIGRARENLSAAEIELMSSTSKEACELWNGRNVIRCQGSARIWQFICLVQDPVHTEPQADDFDEIEYKTLKQALDSDLIEQKCMDFPKTMEAMNLTCALDITGPRHAYNRFKDLLSSLRSKVHRFLHRFTILRPLLIYISSNTHSDQGAEEGRRLSQTCQQPENVDVELANIDHKPNVSTTHSAKGRKITIIRDNDLEAPNLSLNCHNRASRVEIYLMAVIGTLLQIGVLVFFGFITYYRPIQSHFLKDNNPVANYAFPCAAIGTIALVIGMFLCAFVIERSTTETFYAPTSGDQAWIVWLQKNHVVNDQVFQPYAIYPVSGRTFITTSRRSPELDKQKHDKFKYLGLEALTFVGTAISLVGFIVQFIGLRGLNWSASVVQLGAVILMTCARTWVRRGLAEPPISSRLTSDFELDWLALSLKGCKNAPWIKSGRKDLNKDQEKKLDSDPAEETTDGWTIHSGQDRKYRSLEEDSGESSTQKSAAQEVMVIRKELGNLANWQGPASAEAVRLSETIEAVADSFLANIKGSGSKTYTWTLPVRYNMATQPITAPEDDQISIQLTHNGKGWEIPTGDIEAALSLWMYSIRKQERVHDQRQELENPNPQDRNSARLRSRGERKLGLRLFGPRRLKTRLVQDLQWWMPEAAPEILILKDVDQFKSTQLISDGRIVGFTKQQGLDGKPNDDIVHLFGRTTNPKERSAVESEDADFSTTSSEDSEEDEDVSIDINENSEQVNDDTKKRGTLAVECYDALERLCSRDLLFAFIVAVARSPRFPVRKASSSVAIDYTKADQNWMKPKLQSSDLSKLAQKMENKGFGTLSEAYFDLIVPLSLENKLPNVDVLIEMAQKQAQEHELSQQWKGLVDVCSWLLGLATRLDPDKDRACPRAIAICLDIFRRMDITSNLQEAEGRDDGGELRRNKEKLTERLARARLTNLSLFHTLIGSGDPKWDTGILEDQKVLQGPVTGNETTLPKSFGVTTTHMAALSSKDDSDFLRGYDIRRQDSFDWAPVRYRLQNPHHTGQVYFYDFFPQLSWSAEQADFRGWTLLHYACLQGNYWHTRKLLDVAQANVNAVGGDRVTPMHCAAKGGKKTSITGSTPLHIASTGEIAKLLVEKGAKMNHTDNSNYTPLYLALEREKDQVAKVLLEAGAGVKRASITGSTPLHIASTGEIAKLLLEKGAEINHTDNYNCTPLYLALRREKDQVAKVLLEAGADVKKASITGSTPLHMASTGEIAKLLLEKGAEMNHTDNDNCTPLRNAIRSGRDEVARALLEAGADVQEISEGGTTLLHEALTKESVKLLIQFGAEVDRTGHNQWTPLRLA